MVDSRENHTPVLRPAGRCVCVVMACTDMSEAELVGRQLLEVNSACLVTYLRAEDVKTNLPAGKVALFILATADTPTSIGQTLRWLRNRWPSCPVVVVGDEGSGDYELAARVGGACYLTRPVGPEQWNAVLIHALGKSESETVEARKRL